MPQHSIQPTFPSPIVPFAPVLARAFSLTEKRMRAAHETHLGYPCNLSFEPAVPAHLSSNLINGLGDPYVGSQYGSQVCDLEREAVSWLMRLWQCDGREQFWGSVRASGTEGNFWGIYLGREALSDAVLIHSEEAHYLIPKAARIQRIETVSVPCNDAGEIGLDALSHVLAYLNGRPAILALTSGTMMKGAHDNIEGAIARPDAAGISPARRHIHIDGALNAMVVPFLDEAPDFDPPDLPARHREHLHVRPHNDWNADALRRARGAQAACRAHRIGDRIFEFKQHNPVGFAQRPCRACHVGPFLRTKNEWFRETPAIALLELSAWQPRCVEAARPCSSVHFR